MGAAVDYYEPMNCIELICRAGALTLGLGLAMGAVAQTSADPQNKPTDASAAASTSTTPSALTSQLFYQLLLSELQVRSGDAGAGYSIMLDAARKTNDEKLYRRAVEIAYAAQAGEPALQAARSWRQAHPNSREAVLVLMQVLIGLNRVTETADIIKAALELTPPPEREAFVSSLIVPMARINDRKLAALTLEQGLKEQLSDTRLTAAAWTAVGRLRLYAGDEPGAMQAMRLAYAAQPAAQGPILLALELMSPKRPEIDDLLKRYMTQQPIPEVLMAYARRLIEQQRRREAIEQLRKLTELQTNQPNNWLLLGSVQAQQGQHAEAQNSLERYLTLLDTAQGHDNGAGITRAYLLLSDIAQKRKNYTQALAWLDKIPAAQTQAYEVSAQRASVLARQGKMPEALELLRPIAGDSPEQVRTKLQFQAQLLREQRRYQEAYDLLSPVLKRLPQDPQLLYEVGILADLRGAPDEMERLLRQLIALNPNAAHAYNALGYALADRNVRLPEAKQLIAKALELNPSDPMIQDSMGWVEFRLGRLEQARSLLEAAYAAHPDPEIAAHLGEVLWVMGQREQAMRVWREAAAQDPAHTLLQQTLQRLGVKL